MKLVRIRLANLNGGKNLYPKNFASSDFKYGRERERGGDLNIFVCVYLGHGEMSRNVT